MKNSLKSTPPRTRPIGGIRTSLTSEVTIPPNAAPMMTPTARSTTLPRMMNVLNSLSMGLSLLACVRFEELQVGRSSRPSRGAPLSVSAVRPLYNGRPAPREGPVKQPGREPVGGWLGGVGAHGLWSTPLATGPRGGRSRGVGFPERDESMNDLLADEQERKPEHHRVRDQVDQCHDPPSLTRKKSTWRAM